MSSEKQRYDVVVVGGGHNGLVAATMLGRAGLSVLVLERLPMVGGAAISTAAFDGWSARLSRYSYLVSLLPDQLVRDLDLDLELRSRRTASYTPWIRDGHHGGLLVERTEGPATQSSFRELTGSDDEYAAWRLFQARVGELAAVVAPTLLEPLPLEREVRGKVSDDVWTDLVETPIGEVLERTFADDLVRGAVATDALIGSFASTHEASLVQNRCFLHHLMGNGTGEWRVPVGGMGAVTGALADAAGKAGVEVITSAGVSGIEASDDGAEVTWHDGGESHTVEGRWVLSNLAPWVLDILMGHAQDDAVKPVGSQLKINLLLSRLPRLASGIDPRVAFAGTLHLDQGYAALRAAHDQAAAGVLPDVIPGEIYCHSLTDPSILGDAPDGTHTLTYFGIHTPAPLFDADPRGTKHVAVTRALEGLQRYLAEPLEDCLARDSAGLPCIEARIPQEVEADLAMPGGHIYHGDLDWPWAPNRARLDTPAAQWGVQTASPAVLLCGSGARRGGGVSGIGGHNAAQAVLALR